MLNMDLDLNRHRLIGAGFDPASVFGANTGRLYDFKTSAMFTDAGTTPAGIGTAVYRINDRSGGGNHSDQPTLAARGILQAGGIQMDGIANFIPTTWAPTGSVFSIFTALVMDAASGDTIFLGNRNGTPRLLLQCLGTTNAGKLRRVWGGSIVDPASATDMRGVYRSMTMTKNVDDKYMYEGSTLLDNRNIADGLGTSPVYWGAENNAGAAASFAKCLLKGLLIVDNKVLSAGEIAALTTYWST